MDTLTYIGHATTLIRLEGSSILTDPMLRAGLGPLRRQGRPPPPGLPEVADVVLISHLHRDHLDIPSVRRVPSKTPLVVPRGASRWVEKAGPHPIVEVGRGEAVSVGEVEITGVPAEHGGSRGLWGPEIEALGYVISGGGRSVYFAGDTDLFDEMSDIGPVDVALLPVWGWGPSVGEGHLDPEKAARAAALIRPRLAVPIHWGTFYPAGVRRLQPEPLARPPHEFARLTRSLAPEVEVRVLEPGSETSLED
jgi:L-ascorbate metabolism protein UlaG (beta-lactamase superfamily)